MVSWVLIESLISILQIFFPVDGPDVGYGGVKFILDNQDENIIVRMADDDYILPSVEEIELLARLNIFKNLTYNQSRGYDCDDYALHFYSTVKLIHPKLAFGIVWVETPRGNHAMNLFVTQDFDVYLFEPQTNQIRPFIPSQNVKYGPVNTYRPYFILM